MKKIEYEGYNLSCVKTKSTSREYISTIRQSTYPKNGNYPECINRTIILYLDENFNIKESKILDETIDETINNKKYISYSEGIEDCRLIDESSLLCTVLHTNPYWKPEVCYIEFKNNKITKQINLYIEGEQYTKIEKNWLFLKKSEDLSQIYVLYWYNPIKIGLIDINTGKGSIIKSYEMPNNNQSNSPHGGASIYLESQNQYLVTIRNYENKKYKDNSWLLFDEEFNLLGKSDGFIFPVDYEISYQMCMSLILEEKNLYAFVTINELEVIIYSYDLNDVLNKIKKIE